MLDKNGVCDNAVMPESQSSSAVLLGSQYLVFLAGTCSSVFTVISSVVFGEPD